MHSVLVVGGAGYIGSYMCKYLAENGYDPVVLDNLICGHPQAVKWGPLVEGSIADVEVLDRIFSQYNIEAVMHFGAFCYVGESVQNPVKYYRNNVANTLCLLEKMIELKIQRFIFSSSCATYGEPIETPMAEDHPQQPINPYGRSKLMIEHMLKDFEVAYGLNYISFRYFNAAGADPQGEVGEDHDPETHLIPLVLQAALGKRESIEIYGDDYPTPDGTCIRDYIHIHDLARAHLLGLEKLLGKGPGGIYNLGNGGGFSVREVIETASVVVGKTIPFKVIQRRPGDPAVLVGSSQKASTDLGWQPQYPNLQDIIGTAWDWHKRHPNGYES